MREFAVRLPGADVDAVIDACAAQGVNPGYALGRDYEELADGLLVAITEQRVEGGHRQLGGVLKSAVREVARV